MLTPRIVALSALCLITPAALAQVDPQARRALETMVAALEDAQSLTYNSQVHGEGGFFGMLPRSSGTITMKRAEPKEDGQPGPWKVRVEGRTEGSDGRPLEFVVMSDGTRFSWLDHSKRQLIYRPRSAARGQPTDTAVQLQIPQITEANPLQRDLSAPIITLVEEKSVDGVACDVILVDPGELQPKNIWTIARTDGLPRRVEFVVQGSGLDMRQIWTITDVRVNPPVMDQSFVLTAPEGYTTLGAPITAPPSQPAITQTDDGGTVVMNPGQGSPAERVVGTDVGNLAPDFELPMPGGGKVRLSDHRGQVVLLDFWGTWCIPCKRSSPEVQKVHQDYKERGVKVFGLAVRERDDDNPIAYMKENNYTYGLLLRADDVARQYRVRAYPTFIVIGREGEIVHIESGFDAETTFRSIRSAIDRSLRAGPQEPGAVPPKPTGDEGGAAGGGDDAALDRGERRR